MEKKRQHFRYSGAAFFIALLMLINQLFGQAEGQYGTTLPLSYGVGARALGLGRAYVAAANDPTAVFWNPAGLELVPRATFTLFHNQIFEGTMYDFAGFVYPTLTYGTIGAGFARIGTGDIPFRDINNAFLGNSTYEENELYISYGKRLPYNLLGGATFKVRRQQFSFGTPNTTGFGFDLGLMYRPHWEGKYLQNLAFGLSYRNLISPTLKLGSENENEPYIVSFGFIKGLNFWENAKINLVFDYHKSKFENGSLRAGTEYVFRDMGAVRLGFDNSHLAFGAGLKYSILELDYSFSSISSDGAFPPTHRFSVTFSLGKTRDELLLIAAEERRQREKELVERTKEEERQNFIVEHLKKGEEYFSDNKYFDAYVEFQQVVSVDPFNKNANVLLDSANNKIQQELDSRQQKAIAAAVDKELAQENKNYMQLHFEKGQVFLQKNQFTDALIEFNLALERSPNDPIILEAIATGKRRLEEQVKKLVTQGRQEFQSGNYSNALQILSEALVLAPEDPDLKDEINTLSNRIKIQQYVQQALQYYDLGQYQNALGLFEEALKMDPSNQLLKQYIERTKRGMGVVDQEMDQESERMYLKGVDLFLVGKYEEALKIWKDLEKKYPYSKKLQDVIKSAEERLKRTRNQQ
ncbi:MAG: PorV/PorQ family protein [Calditrichia bacterium]